jgi:hypothetical protein
MRCGRYRCLVWPLVTPTAAEKSMTCDRAQTLATAYSRGPIRILACCLSLPQAAGDGDAASDGSRGDDVCDTSAPVCRFLTFAQLAQRFGCESFRVGSGGKSANSASVKARLSEFRPDFALNLRNNMIYDAETIKIPRVVRVALRRWVARAQLVLVGRRGWCTARAR